MTSPTCPVATADQTPWTLIGPVLPGDTPRRQTLAAGTYPDWNATASTSPAAGCCRTASGIRPILDARYVPGAVPTVPDRDLAVGADHVLSAVMIGANRSIWAGPARSG